MRALLIALLASLASCAPSAELAYDFTYAGARAVHQTEPTSIELHRTEVARPYVVLGDIEVTMRQQGAFGVMPAHDDIDEELRVRAAKLGAHAVILVHYGRMGSSWWSWRELRGVGRAIRYR